MPSLEHLIMHYMEFSDGLPTNLRFPVPPAPKPEPPIVDTIPRKKHLSASNANERKMSLESLAATSPKSMQRNCSVPSDVFNGTFLATSPPSGQSSNMLQLSPPSTNTTPRKKSPAKSSDIFGSLIRRPKGLINKKHKNKATDDGANEPNATTKANGDAPIEEPPQSLMNIQFNLRDQVYNVPPNNSVAQPQAASSDDDDFFTRSDKSFANDHMNHSLENDNLVEQIYFVDAPTRVASAAFIYTSFRDVPYFPDSTSFDSTNNNSTENGQTRLDRHLSVVSAASNESEIIRTFVGGESSAHVTRPNYYIPVTSIVKEEKLGDGEFGSVWKGLLMCETANHEQTTIQVAIKTLHDEHCKQNRTEFLREASVMIKLSHHCIVKLIGISRVSSSHIRRRRKTLKRQFSCLLFSGSAADDCARACRSGITSELSEGECVEN